MDLGRSGKTALVTRSYRGTGAGLARILAREGAVVWVHGFEIGAAEAVARTIRDDAGHAVTGLGPNPLRQHRRIRATQLAHAARLRFQNRAGQ